jgi:hypothetical protein
VIARHKRGERLGIYEYASRSQRNNRLRMLWIPTATVLAGIVVINTATFAGAHSHNAYPEAISSSHVVQTFGLKSGASYPIVGGEGANGPAKTGYFRDPTLIRTTPEKGSIVSVEFIHESNGRLKSYILEIPVSRITFDERIDAIPTLTLHLNAFSSDVLGKTVVDDSRPCEAVIRTGLLMCDRLIISTPQITADTVRRGLARLVNEERLVDSATFVVTPEMHDWIKRTRG